MKCIRIIGCDAVIRTDSDTALRLVLLGKAKYTNKMRWKETGRLTQHDALNEALKEIKGQKEVGSLGERPGGIR